MNGTATIDWLLDSDPAIRWQVMRDLTDEPEGRISAERSKVATEGWGARLLALQDPGGHWGRDDLPDLSAGEAIADTAHRRLLRELHRVDLEELAGYLDVEVDLLAAWERGDRDLLDEDASGYVGALRWMTTTLGTYNPKWISTTYTLMLLRDMGLAPSSDQARRAVELVRDNVRWGEESYYFGGETEPCVNGMVVAAGAYFGQTVDSVVGRLLGEQLDDGGWNCEAENGSVRSSFHTTISVLEGLHEYEGTNGAFADVTRARHRAQEYLMERRLLRRLTTGEVLNPVWTHFSFPTRWHYDVLRGLDYLRSAGVDPDERCAEAVELLKRKRDEEGRWLLENTHPGRVHFEMEDGDGRPSRWNTLRAMRVLKWFEGSDRGNAAQSDGDMAIE